MHPLAAPKIAPLAGGFDEGRHIFEPGFPKSRCVIWERSVFASRLCGAIDTGWGSLASNQNPPEKNLLVRRCQLVSAGFSIADNFDNIAEPQALQGPIK